MKKTRTALWALVALLAATGCKREAEVSAPAPEEKPATVATEAAPVAQDEACVSPQPPSPCRAMDELDNREIAVLDATGRKILERLAAGDTATLWEQMHPAAHEYLTQEKLAQELLQFATTDAEWGAEELVGMWFVQQPAPGSDGPLQVRCGPAAEGDPGYVQLLAPAFDAEVALVIYVLPGLGRVAQKVPLWLSKHEGKWRILSIGRFPHSIDGRASADLAKQARELIGQGQTLTGGLLLVTARAVAEEGPKVTGHEEKALTRELERLGTTPKAKALQTEPWVVGDDRFTLIGFDIEITKKDGAVPRLAFTIAGTLDEAQAKGHAESLLAEITRREPAFPKTFDAVMLVVTTPDLPRVTGGDLTKDGVFSFVLPTH